MPTGIYVNEDFPYEILQRRNILRPILKLGLQQECYKGKIKLSYDRLMVEGKAYTIANIHELPNYLNPRSTCEKSNEHAIAFFGLHSPFSNFHKSSFKHDGRSYSCAEQFIQSQKAEKYNNDAAKTKIMLACDPREMKHIGNNIRGYVQQEWECDYARNVAHIAVLNKFSQNDICKQALLHTGDKVIVEASPDRFWGSGVKLKDAGVLDSLTWYNTGGLMAEILATVQEELK